MILPDMTCQQMVDVLDKDRQFFIDENRRFRLAGGVKAARRAGAVYPMLVSHFCTSPITHQRYLIVNTVSSRREAFDGTYAIEPTAIIQTPNGVEAVAQASYCSKQDPNTRGLWYFKAHFFIRYKERMHLDHLNTEEIVRHFVKRNTFFADAQGYVRNERFPDDFMKTCHDGAAFGNHDPDDKRRSIFRTFLSNENMREGYKSQFNEDHDASTVRYIRTLMAEGHYDDAFTIVSTQKFRGDNNVILKSAKKD